ncbi:MULTISPECIES: hypothetical protein [unclassified Methylobacterium]|uniref:hypothetical protein n=1 Tax=unclassified Methylobacterium TaxID=2615210 RepID=UPI00164F1BAD|nr:MULTISPECIES: hypothetical protein [unclassified Methylobacterium]
MRRAVSTTSLGEVRPGTYVLSLGPREEVSISVNLVALTILIWLMRRLRTWSPGPQAS